VKKALVIIRDEEEEGLHVSGKAMLNELWKTKYVWENFCLGYFWVQFHTFSLIVVIEGAADFYRKLNLTTKQSGAKHGVITIIEEKLHTKKGYKNPYAEGEKEMIGKFYVDNEEGLRMRRRKEFYWMCINIMCNLYTYMYVMSCFKINIL
jgi:hypothetical protein